MPLSDRAAARRTRLLEIEAVAETAQQEAAEGFEGLEATAHNPVLARSVEALQLLVGALTGGEVMPRSNLYRNDERVAGLLVDMGQYANVYFEAYDPQVRQRFTIGHELGHFYLHSGGGRVHARCLPTRVDREDEPPTEGPLDPEEEADAFSGAFLMLAEDLKADLVRFGKCVSFLAERYVVSEPAMNRRLKTLELFYSEDRAPV